MTLESVARAEGFSGFIVIAIIYAVLTVVGKINQMKQRQGRPPEPARKPAVRARVQVRRVEPTPAARRPDTRGEAERLEQLLRGLGELAGLPGPAERGPLGRRQGTLSPAEEVEERETLEVEPVTVSLERPATRSDRARVDQDDDAEQLVQRRIQAAAARNRALTAADHRAFDAQIRGAREPVAASEGGRQAQLRQYVIWAEILGKPKGLMIDD